MITIKYNSSSQPHNNISRVIREQKKKKNLDIDYNFLIFTNPKQIIFYYIPRDVRIFVDPIPVRDKQLRNGFYGKSCFSARNFVTFNKKIVNNYTSAMRKQSDNIHNRTFRKSTKPKI